MEPELMEMNVRLRMSNGTILETATLTIWKRQKEAIRLMRKEDCTRKWMDGISLRSAQKLTISMKIPRSLFSIRPKTWAALTHSTIILRSILIKSIV